MAMTEWQDVGMSGAEKEQLQAIYDNIVNLKTETFTETVTLSQNARKTLTFTSTLTNCLGVSVVNASNNGVYEGLNIASGLNVSQNVATLNLLYGNSGSATIPVTVTFIGY